MGGISCIGNKLCKIELKALKAILGVKKGTSNDLVFYELRRSSIIARIKDRQHDFYKKLLDLSAEDAIVKLVMEKCIDSDMIRYYESLSGENMERELREREDRIIASEMSMPSYYRDIGLMNKSDIYSSMLCDYHRTVLTRWRLSNHNLQIERGRYTVPSTPRENRLCTLCETVEDEHHVIFHCPRFDDVRRTHVRLLQQYQTVGEMLNPNFANMNNVAGMLHDIEDRYKELKL